MLSLVLAALVALTAANPVPAATTLALCPAVTKLVTALNQQKPASAFCSSFLRIPVAITTLTQTKTNVATVTSLLSGSTTVTNPIAATVTIFEIPTITVETETTITVTSTSTPLSTVTSALTCTLPSAPVEKRAATVSKPGCFDAFTVSSAISSACKCLSVPTSTTTATANAVSLSPTIVTEGSIVTSTYIPTSIITQPGLPTTTTITTSTQTESVLETAPTATTTTTTYAYPENAPFKIGAVDSSAAGQFLGSPNPPTHPATPYTFGSAGNVFVFASYIGGVLRDVALNVLVIYNQPNDGQIGPQDRSGAVVTCKIDSDDHAQQQQTCPLTCEASWNGGTVEANWNCGGTWYTHDTGSCTQFQPYLVSQ
ncbi:hypothetical protein Q7P35_009675 [Cladosporium inversicolor]